MNPAELPKRGRALWLAAGVLAITLVGGWLRLHDLSDRSLWRDEAQCISIAQIPSPSGIVDALRHEAHPPFYYILQHYWMQLAGRTEYGERLLSVLPAIAMLPLLFLVGCRWFGALAGLAAALICATAPMQIALSQSVRGYSWLALLSLLSIWLLHLSWLRGGWRWAGYVAVTGAVVYTHNWGLFLVLAQNGFALWRLLLRAEWKTRLWPWIGSQAVLGLLYLPWALVLQGQIGTIAVLPFDEVPTASQTMWGLAGEVLAPWPAFLLWVAVLTMGLAPRRPTENRGAQESVGLALSVFCSLGVVATGLPVSLATYGAVPSYVISAALPALYLLLGRGMARLRPKWLIVPVATLALLCSLAGIGRAKYAYTSTLREVAAAVQRQAGPADVIVIAPEYLSPTFNAYFHGEQRQIAFPWVMRRQERIDCVGWNDRWKRAAAAVPATLDVIAERLGDTGRVWLVADIESFPADTLYYGQIRRLKTELDSRYAPVATVDRFRGAPEWAAVYVYARTNPVLARSAEKTCLPRAPIR
jgi:hypothetical protein